MTIINQLASIGMAVGPPLVYLDQYISIVRRRDSTGFSLDVCGVLIVANILRIFFWFGKRFELALLVQSILMIAFQLALLYVCLKYSSPSQVASTVVGLAAPSDPNDPAKPLATSATSLLNPANGPSALPNSGSRFGKRPYNLWQWASYGTFIEFIAALIGVNTVLYIFLSGFDTYVDTIGLVALGLESTLPIPQLLSNFRRKSLSGFRMTVLAGWVFGDAFKTIYFFAQPGNSWQFKATACFQLSVDCLICAQAWIYRRNTTRRESVQLEDEEALGDVSGHSEVQQVQGRESMEVETR